MAISWFDQKSRTMSSLNPDGSVDANIEPRYIPGRQGLLTGLGKALSGITAPFLGDYQWAERQAAADLQRQQSDMEFQALLNKQYLQRREDANQMQLRNATIDNLKAQSEYFRNSGQGLDNQLINYPYPEDLQMTPKTTVYKGIPRTGLVPELKKPLAQNQLSELGGIDSTISDLNKNVETLNKYNIKSGPGYSTSTLPGADIYSQFTKSKEFNTWKADTGRAFQKYRKWATGVAAGYPELQLLSPTFPKASDTNENFISKSLSAINDMSRNRDIVMDYFSKAGYRTGELRNKSKNTEGKLDKNNLFEGL